MRICLSAVVSASDEHGAVRAYCLQNLLQLNKKTPNTFQTGPNYSEFTDFF